jgi:putative ABC transport system ATP-binding protein
MAKPVIVLQKINKIFDTGEEPFYALTDINLTINQGDFVAIVGPSGSGKSTLMNILGLLDHPTSGSYDLDGQDTAHLGETHLASLRNKKIGFVFQNFNLLNRTSALDNVALPLIYAGDKYSTRVSKATKALELVDLGTKLKNRPNQLSGGQHQRVAIARSLVTNPEVILADEPTGNLDTKTGDDIMRIFDQLHKEGHTIVMITHSNELAHRASRQIHIQDGRIKEK